jgi:mevalonate pyrophosphate decarboxylase
MVVTITLNNGETLKGVTLEGEFSTLDQVGSAVVSWVAAYRNPDEYAIAYSIDSISV